MSELYDDNDQQSPQSLADLVGEGKKYKDEAALVKAVFEKDSFIERLKGENAETRAELKARLNLEELADQVFKKNQKPPHDDQPNTPRPDQSGKEESEEKPDITAEFQKLLQQERAKDKRDGNIEKAKAGLKELYGSDYKQSLQKAAEALGVSDQYLADMSGVTPDGFLKLVQSVVPADNNRPTTPPQGSVDASKGPAPDYKKRNAAYYNELRKTDPKKYFSKETQIEMYKVASEQGDAFFSN